jgi:hypothetical protein
MGNEGTILLVAGVAIVGAYILNLGGFRDFINLIGLTTAGAVLGTAEGLSQRQQGIAIGEYNPSDPCAKTRRNCPKGKDGMPQAQYWNERLKKCECGPLAL